MRQAKSYSIVDHELLHGGFLAKLTHLELALYLFLCVVGDKNGRSYYGDTSILRALRISAWELQAARSGLIVCGLIEYRRPDYRVCDLTEPSQRGRTALPSPADGISRPLAQISAPPARKATDKDFTAIRGIIPDGLKSLLRALEERR